MKNLIQRPKNLLTVDQISERIQLGRSWIYSAIRRGEFPAPAIKLGTRCARWDSAAVDAWIEARLAAGGEKQ